MLSLNIFAVVLLFSVLSPVLGGGATQSFFNEFMKLAKQEQELIREQTLILEKILKAQQNPSGDLVKGANEDYSDGSDKDISIDVNPAKVQKVEKSQGPSAQEVDKSEGTNVDLIAASAPVTPQNPDDIRIDVNTPEGNAIVGSVSKDKDDQETGTDYSAGSNNDIPQEWAQRYGARQGSGNTLYMNLPHHKQKNFKFNLNDLVDAAKGQNQGSYGAKERGADYSEAYNAIPRHWVDNYEARQGPDNSLLMNLPHHKEKTFKFNLSDLINAAKGRSQTSAGAEAESKAWSGAQTGQDSESGTAGPWRGAPQAGQESGSGTAGPWRGAPQAGQGSGAWRGAPQAGQESGSGSQNSIPQKWVDRYRAKQGPGNSLYMTIPLSGGRHTFNVEELKNAARD